MKKFNSLYTLIRSLTGAEKRYFQLYARRHTAKGSARCLTLFDAVAAAGEADEKDIIRYLGSGGLQKGYPVHRHHLFGLILESLASYHSSRSTDALLNKYLGMVQMLYRKACFRECYQTILKGEALAEKFEKFPACIEFLRWKQKTIDYHLGASAIGPALQEILRREKELLDRLKNLHAYNSLSVSVYHAIEKMGRVRSSGQRHIYKKIISDKLLSGEHNAISRVARSLHHYILSSYFLMSGDYKNALSHAKSRLQLLETLHREDPQRYIAAYNNMLIILHRAGRQKEFLNRLAVFRKIPERLRYDVSEELRARIFARSLSFELDAYLAGGDFEAGAEKMRGIEKELALYESKMRVVNRHTVYYQLAYLYFGVNDYGKALGWLNKILNSGEFELRQDISSFAHLLNLVVHFELQNTSLLESSVRSAYRFLHKRGLLYGFERLLLNFIRRHYYRTWDKKRIFAGFRQLRKEITALAVDPGERSAFDYFNLPAWLSSKISGRPFARVVKDSEQGVGR